MAGSLQTQNTAWLAVLAGETTSDKAPWEGHSSVSVGHKEQRAEEATAGRALGSLGEADVTGSAPCTVGT